MKKFLLGALALGLSTVASAQTTFDDLSEASDCTFAGSFGPAGETFFVFAQDSSKGVKLIFSNPSWKIKQGDKVGLAEVGTNTGYFIKTSDAVAGPNGFMFGTTLDTAANLFDVTSQGLVIRRNGVVLDRIRLPYGASDSWKAFKSCSARKFPVTQSDGIWWVE